MPDEFKYLYERTPERPIYKVPAPVLRQKAAPVARISKRTQALIDAMSKAMRGANGVGLAAPQLGQLQRIVVIAPQGKTISLVNPVVTSREGEQVGLEGCLSIPGLYGQVKRAMAEGKRIPFEFHYAPSAKWCDVEAVPVSGGVAVYLLDTTERHKALDRSKGARIGEDLPLQKAPAAENGLTVLLVDDDESMRRVTRRILARSGFSVLEAEHGADALRVAAQHQDKIDLLVTDVLMPGIRGPELVEELIVRSPNLRVLYMSGYTDDDISRWGLQPGMAFIHKPFTSEGFTEAINEVLAATR